MEEKEDKIGTRALLENNFWAAFKGEKVIKESKSQNNQTAEVKENKPERIDLTELEQVYEDLARLCVARDADEEILKIIQKVETCLKNFGEDITPFDPLSHLSGLKKPDLTIGAKAVIENTKNFYNGQVECKIEDNGSKIIVVFCGTKKEISYIARGTITANFWSGNEAIDYVYSPGAGKMSVKAFEDKKWIDKSDKFDISWELKEGDINDVKNKDNEPTESIQTAKPIEEIAQEENNESNKNEEPNDHDFEVRNLSS